MASREGRYAWCRTSWGLGVWRQDEVGCGITGSAVCTASELCATLSSCQVSFCSHGTRLVISFRDQHVVVTGGQHFRIGTGPTRRYAPLDSKNVCDDRVVCGSLRIHRILSKYGVSHPLQQILRAWHTISSLTIHASEHDPHCHLVRVAKW